MIHARCAQACPCVNERTSNALVLQELNPCLLLDLHVDFAKTQGEENDAIR